MPKGNFLTGGNKPGKKNEDVVKPSQQQAQPQTSGATALTDTGSNGVSQAKQEWGGGQAQQQKSPMQELIDLTTATPEWQQAAQYNPEAQSDFWMSMQPEAETWETEKRAPAGPYAGEEQPEAPKESAIDRAVREMLGGEEPAEYIKTHGTEDPVRMQEQNIKEALERQDYETARKLLNELTASEMSERDRQQVTDYIDSLYQQGLVRGDTLLTNPRAAYRDKDEYMHQLSAADFSGNAQAQQAADALKDAYDRDPRQFAELLESREGQRYLAFIAAASGGTGKETDRQHNAYEQLYAGQETLKTRNAAAAFQQRGTDEVTRAQQTGGVDANIMDRYLTAQGAVLALNDLYNQMDVGGNSETGRDVNSTTNQYLIRELQQYGIDLSGMDESNFRELIETALEQQSRTAQATRDKLAQLGYDPEAVERLMEYSRQVSYEQARQQAAQDFAEDRKENHNFGTFLDDVALTAATIGENVWLSPLENISTWAQLGASGSTNNPNEYVPVAGQSSNAALARGAVAGQMSDVGAFFYNALTSAADSALNVYSFGGAGSLAMMGANAATQTANEILQKGGSNEQAIVGGLAAGAIEVLTEKFSVENLINIKNGGAATVRALLESIGVNMFTEASEETAGAALELIVDALNMGDQSESAQAIDAMVANGISREDAVKQNWKDNLGEVLESAASGAVSGGVSAGVTGGATMIDNAVQQNLARNEALQNLENNLTRLYEQATAQQQAGQTQEGERIATEPSAPRNDAGVDSSAQAPQNDSLVTSAEPQQTQAEGPQGVSEEAGTVSPVDTVPQTVTEQSQQAYEQADEERIYGPTQEEAQQEQEIGITQYRAMNQYRGVQQTEAEAPAAQKNERPALPEAERPSGKERQVLYNTMDNSPDFIFGGQLRTVSETVKELAPEATVYDEIHNLETMAEANDRLHDDPDHETEFLQQRDREWTAADVDTAMGLSIMKINEGDRAGAVAIAAEAARRGTVGGQMIQAFDKWSRTPQGAATKVVGELMTDGTIGKQRAERLSGEVLESAARISDLQNQMKLLEDGTPSRQRQREIQQGYLDEIMRMARMRNTVGAFSHDVSKAVQWALGKLDNQTLNDIAVSQIRSAGSDLTHKTTLAEKAATAQALSQLSSLVTINRNLVGNFGFDLVDTISGNLGVAFDALFSARSGKRTMAFDSGWFHSAKRTGAANGFLRSFAEVALDVNTANIENRYGQTSNRTFKMASDKVIDRFFSTWEKYSGYTLTSTDEFFKGGTRESFLARTQKFVESGKLSAEDQARLADWEARERTFQQDTNIAQGANALKNALNKMVGFGGSTVLRGANGEKFVLDRTRANDAAYIRDIAARAHVGVKTVREALNNTTRFGLGNAALNYPKVPSNLALLAFSYTPVGGAILSTYYTAKALQAGVNVTPEMQHKAALAIGRTITGTAMVAGFQALARAGVLLVSGFSGDDDDKDRDAQRKANGLKGTQLNIDALGRWLQGKDANPQEGDNLLSLAFLEPISGLMTVGALLAQSDGTLGDAAKYSLSGTLQTLYDMPVMEPFRNLYDNLAYSKAETEGEKFGDAALGLLGDLVAGFVPAPLRNLARASDKYERDTSFEDTGSVVGNAAARVKNQVMSNIPGLRQKLPVRTDAYGNPVEYNASDGLRIADALALPGAFTEFRTTATNEEAERLHQAGEGSGKHLFPSKKTPSSITVGSDDNRQAVALNNEQREALKVERGQRYTQYTDELLTDERYRNATDAEKARMRDAAYSTAYEQAKVGLGVGYESDDKIAALMADGLSFADAYDVANWKSGGKDGEDRGVDAPRSAELWAYTAHIPGSDSMEETELTRELRRVFEANEEQRYFSANAPDQLTVGPKGETEKIDLTDEQQQAFLDQRGTVFANLAETMMQDERYQNADDETRLDMMDKLYDIAGEAAKDSLGLGYESTNKMYDLLQTGLDYSDIYAAKEYRDQVDEMVKESGDEDDLTTHALGMNAKAATFKAWVDNQDWTQAQKDAVLDKYGTFTSMSFSDTAKYDALTATGVSPDDAAALLRTLGNLKPDEGYSTVRPVQRWRAISESNLTEEQKRQAMVYYFSSESQAEKFNTFLRGSGLTVADYVKISEDKATHGSDAGNWTKATLTKYLNESDYTNEQKYWIWEAFGTTKVNQFLRYKNDGEDHPEYRKQETEDTSEGDSSAAPQNDNALGAAQDAGGAGAYAGAEKDSAEVQAQVSAALEKYRRKQHLTLDEWYLLYERGLMD